MAESSRSAGKKRARDEEDETEEEETDGVLGLVTNLTFSDTLVALQMMRAQFPKIEKVSILPFILRSQLYCSVTDRTQVDRDLETLKKQKVLRLFKLNTGQDDHAIMFTDDFLRQVDIAVKRLGAKQQQDIQVVEWFNRHVIESKLDVSIAHQELLYFLSFGGKVKDKDVTLLISAGLLGRKELLSFLNRRKYKEMLLATLEKKRLRLSPLDMRFHLRDLIGSGHLKTIHTPTGLLVRVSKD